MLRAHSIPRWFRFAVILALAGGLRAPAQSPAPQTNAAAAKQAAPSVPPDPHKAKQEYERGRKAEDAGDWQAAFEAYREAATRAPKAREYLLRRELARSRLVQQHVDRAEGAAVADNLDEARRELEAALALDPADSVARERLEQLAKPKHIELRELPPNLSGTIRLQPQPGTRNFDYKGDTQGAYEEVARQFGVQAAFDVDLHPRPVRLRISNVDFDTAMRALAEMTKTFWRPLSGRMFFVAEDTPQKRKDYAASIVRTVLLSDSATPDQMTEMLRIVREIAGVLRADLDVRSRTITLRDSPAAIALATRLLSDLEKPPGELILDIEILEVNRDVARNLGITPPETASAFTLSQADIQEAEQSAQGLVAVLTRLFGQPSSLSGLSADQIASLISSGQLSLNSLIPPLVAFGGGRTTFLATLPGAVANFSNTLSLVQQGRRILLRAEDGRPATFFVGDRVPVSLATFSASLGSSTFVPGVSSQVFPRTDFTVGKQPVALAAGKFEPNNPKDSTDLAVVNQGDNTVSILLNDGTGTFTPVPGTPPATGTLPSAIVTGLFNSNSLTDQTDLAVTNFNCAGSPLVCGAGSVSILLNNGDGLFTPAPSPATGLGPVALVAGNFDPNNTADKTDLAVVNQADNSVTILLGNGDGTFTQAPTGSPFKTGNKPVAIAAGKFNSVKNANDHTDLAVVNQTDNTVQIFLSNGDGTFTLASTLTTGSVPTSIATADFNADGIADLAVTSQSDSTVSIFLGNGDGTFSAKTDFPTGSGPAAVVTGDFNSDGRPDLAVADQSANAVSVLIGLGDGTFAPKLDVTTGNSPVAVLASDLNNDNRQDLVTANSSAGTISVILNTFQFTAPGAGVPQTPFPGIQFLDLGLKVKATPRIHAGDEVTLQMQFDISSLTGTDLNGIPVISNRTIEQTVRLRENQTTALAGILERDELRNLNGNPGLSGLPGFGPIISARKTEYTDSELLILITPRMVRLAPRKNHSIYAGPDTGKTGSSPSDQP